MYFINVKSYKKSGAVGHLSEFSKIWDNPVKASTVGKYV